MRKIPKGKPLQETVKGSLEYTCYEINRAFRAQFGYQAWNYCIVDTFADHLILRDFDLPQDEFWRVSYSADTDGDYTFALVDQWEKVELAYAPSKDPLPPEIEPPDDGMDMGMDMGDRARLRRHLLHESLGSVRLTESTNAEGFRRVRGTGMSMGIVNDNNRRYPRPVVEDAVKRALSQYGNPAGRIGRGPLLGESEHPSDRGQFNPLWGNTIFVWDSLTIEGNQVIPEGYIVPTKPDGENAIILLEHKVFPGLSMRGYGRSVLLQEAGGIVEEVQELELIAFDATINPADSTADLILQEAAMRKKPLRGIAAPDDGKNPTSGSGTADPPAPTPTPTPPSVAAPTQPLADSLSADDRRRLDALADNERRQLVSTAIDTALQDAPYAAPIRQQIADAVRALDLPSVEAVPGAIERQRAVADAMLSAAQLHLMGRPGPSAPVISGSRGMQLVPDYAKPQLALTDSLVRSTFKQSNLARVANPRTVNERFAQEYLKRFDAAYKHHLIAEARVFEDAEQAADLNLPYTVARTVIAEMLPTLIATSLFDVQMVDPAPIINLPYETYAAETGLIVTATAEAVVTPNPINQWFSVANKFLTPGTVVVKNAADAVTYVEGTDYVLDIMGGRLKVITGSAIAAGATIHVSYTASAIAKGEMQPIERGKMTLAFFPMTMLAERLGTQISSEAIVFSRAAIGYDATGRTLNRLIVEIGRYIDAGLLQLALAEALQVANNSGGTWTAATDTYDALIAKVGVAKVKVSNRFFDVTGIVMSETNSDRLGNSAFGTQAGSRPDDELMGNGFVGRLKGQPVYATTQFTDSYIMPINREVVFYRIGQPLTMKGPYASYDPAGTGKLVAADQYYCEQYAAATGDPAHAGKASTVKIV